MNYLLLLFIIVSILFYSVYIPDRFVSCDEKLEQSCKMYNTRDINSKCTGMCMSKYNTQFSGHHIKKDNIHTCECGNDVSEKFTESEQTLYDVEILPEIIPDDKKFSNRDYVQNQEENRYNKLIFG